MYKILIIGSEITGSSVKHRSNFLNSKKYYVQLSMQKL